MTSRPMQARLLEPGDPLWPAALSTMPHDVYHLPSYVEFAARRQDAGTALGFLAEAGEQRLFAPLIVRPIPAAAGTPDGGLRDAVSPRGFPGPLFSSGSHPVDDEFADAAVEAFAATLRGSGIVSAYLRLHPILQPPLAALRRAGAVVDSGDTVIIDLSLSSEELWRQTRDNHRRDINKARRAGYRVRIDSSWERLLDFFDIYSQSMERLDAAPFWRLSLDYFADLRAALEGHIYLCVAELGDELASAALLTEVDGIAEYHLAGTADGHVGSSPSKSVIDFARTWAKERGDRVLHLAGSPRKGDPLISFKLGFSPLLDSVYSWRVIADREAYDRLTEGSSGAGPAARPSAADDFFPAYRRPPLTSTSP